MTLRFATATFVACCLFLTQLTQSSAAANRNRATLGPQANTNKYALMVGIDKYRSTDIPRLSGAVNDIKDMREILVKNFGFPDDADHIVMLTDEQATRQGILDAFRSHLIETAKKLKAAHQEGIFLFEYSGHGSQVKDTNGDEADDGKDETIVPVDSRLDGHYDIVDDELNILLKELTKYTDNTIMIMDSCHSGTGTRGNLIIRAANEDTRSNQPAQPPLSQVQDQAPTEKYVSIAGCLPIETSAETPAFSRPNGLMTKALIQALKTAPNNCTFRDLGHQLTAAVNAQRPDQHPLIEGDLDRHIFADSSEREEPYIKVLQATAKTVTIDAGAVQGVRCGSVVALYKPTSGSLTGDRDVLAKCLVKQADQFTSTLDVPPGCKADLVKAKAKIVTPFFATKLRLCIDSKCDPKFAKEISEAVDAHGLLSLTATQSDPLAHSLDWDLSIMSGTIDQFKKLAGVDNATPNQEAKVGYFIVPPSGEPLFGMFIGRTDEDAADKVLEALYKEAKQNNIRTLSNRSSGIDSDIDVQLLKVVKVEDREIEQPVDFGTRTGTYIKLGDRIRLKITNKGKEPLYVALLAINPSGSIGVLYPPLGAKESIAPGSFALTKIITVTKPAGLETVKVMVTTSWIDYSFLKQSAVQTRAGDYKPPRAKSLLEQLLCDGSAIPRMRDVEIAGDVNADVQSEKIESWATKNVDIVVKAQSGAVTSTQLP